MLSFQILCVSGADCVTFSCTRARVVRAPRKQGRADRGQWIERCRSSQRPGSTQRVACNYNSWLRSQVRSLLVATWHLLSTKFRCVQVVYFAERVANRWCETWRLSLLGASSFNGKFGFTICRQSSSESQSQNVSNCQNSAVISIMIVQQYVESVKYMR